MIADISFIERRIEEKIKSIKKHQRKNRRTPFYSFLALAIMITGTLGGYLTLSHAATAVRRAPLYFQGRITDANYVPLADTSSRNMAFRIHTHATNTACVWSVGTATEDDNEETNNCALTVSDTTAIPVTVTRGVFTVPLGDTSYHANMARLREDFDNQSSEVYYLEIIVKNSSGTYETLSPRVRIGSSPYAYNTDELDGLNSTSFLRVDGTTTQTASTSGSPTAISFTGAAHTGLTASTEATDVNFNFARTVQFATGALATQRAFRISSPTYAFAGASTLTNAATLAITGMPVAGTNATITNRYGLLMQGDSNATVGQFMNISYPSAVTSTGTVAGQWIDFTNLAIGTAGAFNFSYGSIISTPSINNTTTNSSITTGLLIDGYQSGASRVTHSGATGSDTWRGLEISMPQQTQTAGTTASVGLTISRTAAVNSGTTAAITTGENAGNVGIGTLSPDFDLEITNSDTAADGGILITKTDTNNRDPIIQFSLADGDTTGYTIGVDDSDSDKFKFGMGGLNSAFFTYDNTQTGLTAAFIFDFANFASTLVSGANNFYRMFHLTPAPLTLSGTGTMDAGAIETFNIDAMSIAAGTATATDAVTLSIDGAPQRTSGTLTTSYGILVKAGVLGTVTTSYGMYVNAQTGATTNYAGVLTGGNVGIGTDTTPDTGLDIGGTLSYTPSTTQTITAVGNAILANAAMVVLDPNADLTLTSAATIADGATGQILYITAGNSEANTVTLQDQDTLASSNLQLGAATRAIAGRDVLVLMFDGTDWIEISFANN